MNKKNLRRKIFENASKGLAGIALLGLTSCAAMNTKVMGEIPKPVKINYKTNFNKYFGVFDKDKKETGVYLEEELYKKISEGKEKGELVEIPNHEGLYVKSGQGRWADIKNSLKSGGSYMCVYDAQGNKLDGFYVSELTIRSICYKNTGEQSYDGRFVKIPETNLEAGCVVFDEVKPIFPGSDGGNGGAGGAGNGGSGGGTGGGGQGGGGGDSSGSR